MTDREKLIEMLKTIYKEYSVSPSVDLIANYLISHGVVVRDVVRCKDCKHRSDDKDDPYPHCWLFMNETEPDDFCSLGERKDCEE